MNVCSLLLTMPLGLRRLNRVRNRGFTLTKVTIMVELFFIRHGQASFGRPAYDHLSPLGERQAALLGRYFNDSGIRFDAVYAGSMRRHIQTATITLAQMDGHQAGKINIDADFNEFDSSDRMMHRLYQVMREDPELSERLKRIHTDHGAIARIFEIAEQTESLPGNADLRMRSARAFRERIGRAIANLVGGLDENHHRVAVFTSGGPTAVALRNTLETSREQTLRLGWELRNTSITRLRYDQGRLWLVLFNCVAHLESQHDSSLITYI